MAFSFKWLILGIVLIIALTISSQALNPAFNPDNADELAQFAEALPDSDWLPVGGMAAAAWLALGLLLTRFNDRWSSAQMRLFRLGSLLILALAWLGAALQHWNLLDMDGAIAGWQPWMWLLIGVAAELMLLEACYWWFEREFVDHPRFCLLTVLITGLAVAGFTLQIGPLFEGWQAWMWLPAGAVAKPAALVAGYLVLGKLAGRRRSKLAAEASPAVEEIIEATPKPVEAPKPAKPEPPQSELGMSFALQGAVMADLSEKLEYVEALERARASESQPWRVAVENREPVTEAQGTLRQMRELAESGDDARRSTFSKTVTSAEHSVEEIEKVVSNIARAESDPIPAVHALAREGKIERIQAELENEQDPVVKKELESQLDSLNKQKRAHEVMTTINRRVFADVQDAVESLRLNYIRMVQLSRTGSADGSFARQSKVLEEESSRLEDQIVAVYDTQRSHQSDGLLLSDMDEQP